MYAENTPDVDEDFFNALALLHSTEENSTEKLRRMLDACIEKKHGAGRTLAVRMPKRFLRHVEPRDDSAAAATRTSRRREYTQERASRSEVWDGSEIVSLLEADVEERAEVRKVFEMNYEACCNDEEIPRISIPDEGSVDGNTTVCKVFFSVKVQPTVC